MHVLGEDFEAVVYEDLGKAAKSGPDYANINQLIADAKSVLLFHTRNVESTEHTKAWVHHEVSQASSAKKSLVVFQQAGSPPTIPITYWTDVAVIDPNQPQSVVKIQAVAKNIVDGHSHIGPIARTAFGATVGAIAGPVGAAAGAFLGLLTNRPNPLGRVPVVACFNCKRNFRYWGIAGSVFTCPNCLTTMTYSGPIKRGGR